MPIYDVHLFPLVRVKVRGVEADSQIAAIGKAEAVVNLNQLFDRTGDVDTEYAEEISHYLVDEEEDPEFERSEFYHFKDGVLQKGSGDSGNTRA